MTTACNRTVLINSPVAPYSHPSPVSIDCFAVQDFKMAKLLLVAVLAVAIVGVSAGTNGEV